MQRKAQAAMEFLMTYGWALLVVLTAIGALAFFGVLNPSGLLPETCFLGPGFACEDFKVEEPQLGTDFHKGRIFITVRNGIGSSLDTFTIHPSREDTISDESCGSMLGYIAYRENPSSVATDPFADGEAKPLQHFGSSDLNGINCYNVIATNINCCVYLSKNFYDNKICKLSQPISYISDCNLAKPTPKAGRSYNEDLIISFRKNANSILHVREGQLRAKSQPPT